MEQENDTPDPEFVKGFNEGYTLAKHSPDLSKQLGEITVESPRSQGFKEGRAQHALEQKQERYPAWLKSDRLSKGISSPGKTKGRDRTEPER